MLDSVLRDGTQAGEHLLELGVPEANTWCAELSVRSPPFPWLHRGCGRGVAQSPLEQGLETLGIDASQGGSAGEP